MDKKRILIDLALVLIGAAVMYIGGFVLDSQDQTIKMISGLCIGCGAVALAFGIGDFFKSLILSKAEDEEIKRRKNIEVGDERNTRIREKAGAASNRIMVYVITAFVLILGFMNAPKFIIIMASALLIVQMLLAIFLSNYYSKTM